MKKLFFGLMFHHFHDGRKFFKTTGSIQKDDFYKIIKFFGKKNIISPAEFYTKYKKNKINKNEICLTFDDGLKSQFKIAFPIMQDLNIKGFFFIPSSIFENKTNMLETVRYFKENFYKSINDYYDDFYLELKKITDFNIIKSKLKKNQIKFTFLKKKFNFYSIEDIKYRFVRDFLISKKNFEKANRALFKKKKFNYKKIHTNFFMTKKDIKILSNNYNDIGLHSHSHPTNISNLSYNQQLSEYRKNKNILEKIINKKIKSMSHPCGKYNLDTLKILNLLKIKNAFLPDKNKKFSSNILNHSYLIPREDHANLINKFKNNIN